MKRNHRIGFLALLFAAAILGWLLPSAVFRLDDRMEEGKTSAVEIRQVDLNYQTDMDIQSRLHFAQRIESNAVTTPLEHGIYLQKQDVEKICEQFLQDLTGTPILSHGDINITPMLFGASDGGTMIVWMVSGSVNECSSWEVGIDDQTGLLLSCCFFGLDWAELFPDFGKTEWKAAYISSRLSGALCAQFNDRLDADFSDYIQSDYTEAMNCAGTIILSENDTGEYDIPFTVSVTEGVILLN